MPSRKPWWQLNDEQAWKNRQKTSATTRPVPPGGVAVMYPGSRPPVYTLPNPWPPYVPPRAEPEQVPRKPGKKKKKKAKAVVPRKPRKKKLSALEEARLVDALVDGGMSLTDARQQIATRQKKTFFAIERASQRYGRHKGSNVRSQKNLSSKNRKKKNH